MCSRVPADLMTYKPYLSRLDVQCSSNLFTAATVHQVGSSSRLLDFISCSFKRKVLLDLAFQNIAINVLYEWLTKWIDD